MAGSGALCSSCNRGIQDPRLSSTNQVKAPARSPQKDYAGANSAALIILIFVLVSQKNQSGLINRSNDRGRGWGFISLYPSSPTPQPPRIQCTSPPGAHTHPSLPLAKSFEAWAASTPGPACRPSAPHRR